MKDDDFTRSLLQFIAQHVGVDPTKLHLTTRILHDLGCTGDDADELMAAFAERYNVDMSDFEFDRYFGPEGTPNLFVFIYHMLFHPEKLRFVPITVEDMLIAARTQKWPVITADPV